jgi:O-antigen/teichoic acid export membrane protein
VPGEYNIFSTALSALGILSIPALGMQTVFAAQAAGSESDERRRELGATMRCGLGLLAVIWIGLAGWWFLREKQIMAAYSLTSPVMLWILLGIVLATLWTSVLYGTLQGRQEFLTLGSVTLLNGVGRFVVLFAVVYVLKGGAMGALLGVLAGTALVLGIVAWKSWPLLTAPSGIFRWREWLHRLIPLTVGLGALNYIMQADALVVREKLQPILAGNEVDGYSAVRSIGMALVFVVGGITTVMFAKVARSFHLSEKSEALKLTVLMTAAIGLAGAALATVFPELPLKILAGSRLLGSHTLVPPYCWALLPVALANVIIWSLLARESYRIVPWLFALAVAYRIALERFHDRLMTVILVLGIFGLLMLALCAICLKLDAGRAKPASAPVR